MPRPTKRYILLHRVGALQYDELVAQPVFAQDDVLIAALRDGDEAAFSFLIDRYHTSLVRLATTFCRDEHVAEEVVQETWIAVLKGIEHFEGRSSLKTWLFSILSNKAKTRGVRESRSVAFSQLVNDEVEADDPAVDPTYFDTPATNAAWVGWWHDDHHPSPWQNMPEGHALASELRACISRAIAQLPTCQGQVITLRDVLGYESDEACNVLGISETNQRVLLHRARSKVRRALEKYFDEQ